MAVNAEHPPGREAGKLTPDGDASPSQGSIHTLIHIVFHTYGQFSVAGPPSCVFLNGGRKTEEMVETSTEAQGELHAESNPSSGSNPGPWTGSWVADMIRISYHDTRGHYYDL